MLIFMFKTCPFVTLLGLFGHPWNFGPGKSETVSNDHFPISNWLGVTLSHDFTLLPQGKTCPPPHPPFEVNFILPYFVQNMLPFGSLSPTKSAVLASSPLSTQVLVLGTIYPCPSARLPLQWFQEAP